MEAAEEGGHGRHAAGDGANAHFDQALDVSLRDGRRDER